MNETLNLLGSLGICLYRFSLFFKKLTGSLGDIIVSAEEEIFQPSIVLVETNHSVPTVVLHKSGLKSLRFPHSTSLL